MLGKRKLKAEIVRLTYRVKELEERLCPCEGHFWVKAGKEYRDVSGEVEVLYRLKCRRCGKEIKRWSWEV